MKTTALLLIDLQNDYFPGGRMELAGADKALQNARSLLRFARKEKMTVTFMRHQAVQPGATFFLPGTKGVQIHDALVPLAHEPVMDKNFPNSFRQTALEKYLKSRNISQLLLCGMMSHMCVDATTRAAFDKNFTCILAHDACATTSLQFLDKTIGAEQVHGSFMAALGARYAKVATTTDCIDFLTKLSARQKKER
ncbi:MAG: cysteine hydrolase [Desulfobulbus sp.]|nr:MAG: cysteine hydrolase [Desulfobulbus sp.]